MLLSAQIKKYGLLVFCTCFLLSCQDTFAQNVGSKNHDNASPHDVPPLSEAQSTAPPTPLTGTSVGGQTQATSEENTPYELMVVAKKAKGHIAVYCTLAHPVDSEHLAQLGDKVFAEVKGTAYQYVFVSWFLQGQSKNGEPWAVTNYGQGQRSVNIFSETKNMTATEKRKLTQPVE